MPASNNIEIHTQRTTGVQQSTQSMQSQQSRQHQFYHLQNIKQSHHHPAAIPAVAVYPTSTPMMTTGGNNNVATRRDATNNTWLLNQQRHNNNQRGTSRFTVTPTIVQQTITEFTECSKQGTLSPTSNCVSGTAGGGEITPPGSTRPQIPTGVLLKAARDCDDFALTNVLKRGLLVGLPECELNATDSTGRVSTILNFVFEFDRF